MSGNQTILEESLDSIDVDWEITRYSGVVHGFTKWDSEDAYSLTADVRSWDSMLSVFDELLDGPTRVGETASGETTSAVQSIIPSIGLLASVLVSSIFLL